MIGTQLSGEAATVKVQLSLLSGLNGALVVFPNLVGTLKTSAGAPLAGRSVKFSLGTTVLCTAVTNAQGVATCASSIQSGLGTLLNLGYTLSFAGDADYLASTARGPIVQVLTLKL
jgi:hypothetical protein